MHVSVGVSTGALQFWARALAEALTCRVARFSSVCSCMGSTIISTTYVSESQNNSYRVLEPLTYFCKLFQVRF